MVKESDGTGYHERSKASLCFALDEDTVTRKECRGRGGPNEERSITVLHKQQALIPARINNGSLGTDGNRLTGIRIAEKVHSLNRCEDAGLSGSSCK
jgi:hypothetical protein